MNAAQILHWCEEHDVRIASYGDQLQWNAPKGTVSDEFKETLRRHKRELLRILSPQRPITLFTDLGLGVQSEPRRLAVAERNDSQPLVPARAVARARLRRPTWVTGPSLEVLPEVLQGLVCEREGWSPDSWAEYLLFKARACRALHPELADRYEEAARKLCHG